ncbi:alpha/beta hydrolase [Maricurvus nonylphenolicus]|uniref:alpha/beta hydrolase n=1 Tax=Maricurvus nonylphenolicus TaxID=1008307 RepID=UPI0036F3F1B2
MSKEELDIVLTMLDEVRGGDLSQKPLWQQRGEMDLAGLTLPMPEEPVDITQFRAYGVPGLKFTPEGGATDKALLYMHGGGYVIGSAASHRHFVARLAVDAGITAWSIDYRLAPEWAYPAPVEDAVAAYRYLLEQGFTADNIVVSGDSAGGGLAAALLVALKHEGLPQPAGAMLLSPWTDLTQSGESYETRAEIDPLVKKVDLDEMAATYVQGGDLTADTASPLFADLSDLAPLYIQVGDAETMLSDSLRFAEKAKAAGVEVKLDQYPDMIHIWPYFWPLLSEAREACDKLSAFCKEKLG